MDYQQPPIMPIAPPTDYTESHTPAYMDTADAGLIQYQLNIDDILKRINKYLTDKEASKILIREIMSVLEPIAGNRGIFLSNFEEADILNSAFENTQAITFSVFEYGDNLTDSQKDIIIAMCSTIILAALRRPYLQGERKFLSKTVERKEIYAQKEPEKRQFRRLFKW
ncbi:hypothetical protein KKE60_04910 [Patescibacteria group bacterium]|nr:hypothetical protein [Patescibacteria group bacterium]